MQEFKEIESKKKKYKRKLEDIQQESLTQDQELQILKNKVRDEIQDLNKINF